MKKNNILFLVLSLSILFLGLFMDYLTNFTINITSYVLVIPIVISYIIGEIYYFLVEKKKIDKNNQDYSNKKYFLFSFITYFILIIYLFLTYNSILFKLPKIIKLLLPIFLLIMYFMCFIKSFRKNYKDFLSPIITTMILLSIIGVFALSFIYADTSTIKINNINKYDFYRNIYLCEDSDIISFFPNNISTNMTNPFFEYTVIQHDMLERNGYILKLSYTTDNISNLQSFKKNHKKYKTTNYFYDSYLSIDTINNKFYVSYHIKLDIN